MKKPGIVLRLLCGILDALVVMIPVQFIMMGIFQVSPGQADLFFKLLYAVYGTLLTEYCGMTLGKYFGKTKVLDVSGQKPAMVYLGLRELAKSLYFIPYLGWGIGAASLVMMTVRKDGRALHDLIGETRVVGGWRETREKEEHGHGHP